MTKAELIERMASGADLTKAKARQALEALADAVIETLQKGEKVALVGLGTFEVSQRKARTGRNPQTGKPVQIAAHKAARFRPGKALKEAVK